jgi:hypothetical protein
MRGTPANVRQGRMAAFMPVARLLATGLLVACAPAGCRATLVPPDGQDPARVQVQALERTVAALEARNAELGAQLDALRAQTGSQVPEDVLVATPRLVGVALVGTSSVTPAVGDPPTGAAAQVVLETRDGMGRFVQVAGRAEVAVTLAPVGGDPRVLGRRALGPAELRDAYRAGLMGTHYTIDVPLELPAGLAPGTPLAVTVEVTDGWTGQVHRTAGTLRAP